MSQTLYILCISGMITMLLSGYIIGEKLTRMSISKSLEQAIRGLETMDKKIFKLSDHIGKVGDEWRKKAIDEIYADMPPPPKKETAYASSEQSDPEWKEINQTLKQWDDLHKKDQDEKNSRQKPKESIYEIAMELGYKKQFMDAVPWQDVFLHQNPQFKACGQLVVVDETRLNVWSSWASPGVEGTINRYVSDFLNEQKLQAEEHKPIDEKIMHVEIEPAPEPTLNEYLDKVAPEDIHKKDFSYPFCIEPCCPNKSTKYSKYCDSHFKF